MDIDCDDDPQKRESALEKFSGFDPPPSMIVDSAVIAAMAAHQVDAMEVGPFSFVIAEREANAEPIAVGAVESSLAPGATVVYDPNVLPFYYSVFITKKGNVNGAGNEIRTLQDLEGVDFAFVDPASTSGRNAPVVRLIHEIPELQTPGDVDSWLNPIFAGSHPSAVLALVNGDVQAAATYEGNLCRADLVLVHENGGYPRVRGTLRRGVPIY